MALELRLCPQVISEAANGNHQRESVARWWIDWGSHEAATIAKRRTLSVLASQRRASPETRAKIKAGKAERLAREGTHHGKQRKTAQLENGQGQ